MYIFLLHHFISFGKIVKGNVEFPWMLDAVSALKPSEENLLPGLFYYFFLTWNCRLQFNNIIIIFSYNFPTCTIHNPRGATSKPLNYPNFIVVFLFFLFLHFVLSSFIGDTRKGRGKGGGERTIGGSGDEQRHQNQNLWAQQKKVPSNPVSMGQATFQQASASSI